MCTFYSFVALKKVKKEEDCTYIFFLYVFILYLYIRYTKSFVCSISVGTRLRRITQKKRTPKIQKKYNMYVVHAKYNKNITKTRSCPNQVGIPPPPPPPPGLTFFTKQKNETTPTKPKPNHLSKIRCCFYVESRSNRPQKAYRQVGWVIFLKVCRKFV